MEKNWERSANMFSDRLMLNDKCIYLNDKSQALSQMSYALRTLRHSLMNILRQMSCKHGEPNVLQANMK
jgi:hypothetical protein